jgi:hypothetical protein
MLSQSTTDSDKLTAIVFAEDRFINNKISCARDLREKASDKFSRSLHHFDILLCRGWPYYGNGKVIQRLSVLAYKYSSPHIQMK